jgi:xanthine dehydrogenase accessory factor
MDRLRKSGISDIDLQKVHAPIGLRIGAVSPEEIAVSILAEIISVFNQGQKDK